MTELKDGCVSPAKGPILPSSPELSEPTREVTTMTVTAKVGREAIDFEANAYVEGVGFQNIKLSDYKGKWIVLCFYPGDFTFV
jgi:peroxiredoxin (alkyl hydroperoxide reductase subunit C)